MELPMDMGRSKSRIRPMGLIDEYVRAQTEPNLRPGESIRGIGYGFTHGKFSVLGTPEDEATYYLLAATDQRLVLLKARVKKGLSGVELLPTHFGTEVWDYADLSQVEHKLGNPGALSASMLVRLIPQWGKGPRWRDDKHVDLRLTASSLHLFISKIDLGMPDQPRIHETFGPWLRQQVMAGAFTGGVPPQPAVPPPTAATPVTSRGPRPQGSLIRIGAYALGGLGLLVLLAATGPAGYAVFDLADWVEDEELRAQQEDATASRLLREGDPYGEADHYRSNARMMRASAANAREQISYYWASSCGLGSLGVVLLGGGAFLFARARRQRAG